MYEVPTLDSDVDLDGLTIDWYDFFSADADYSYIDLYSTQLGETK